MNKLGFVTQGASTDLHLEAGAEGEARSIIDFQPLPATAASLTTRTELKIQSAAETSRKGVVRILLKVNLPYSGLYASDVATGASNLKFSPNRSLGAVSAHLVLTLPKECVQDLVQQKAGSIGRRCALAHVQTVLAILETINLAGNGAVTALEDSEQNHYISPWASGNDPMGLDSTSGTPVIAANELDNTKLATLIDRACRGYTPLGDVEKVGVTAVLGGM